MKKEKTRQQKKGNDLLYMTRHYKNKWWAIFLGIILSVVGSLLTSKVPDETSKLFDGAFQATQLWYVIKLTLMSAAVSFAATVINSYAMAYGVKSLQKAVWKKMLKVGISYYDENDPSSQASLLTNDAEVGAWIPQVMAYLPSMITLIGSSLLMIFSYNAKLLYVLVPIFLMNIVYLVLVGKWQEKLSVKSVIRMKTLTGYLAERIRNLAMIKVFTAEEKERSNGQKVIGDLYKIGKEVSVLATVIVDFATVSTIISTVLTVLWGCQLLKQGEITQEQFIAFSAYVPVITLAFALLSIVWTFVKGFKGQCHNINNLFNMEDEQLPDSARTAEPDSGDIVFNDVSFQYTKASDVTLQNVSFTIPKDKVTAIVGPSGSGKTTVVKLIEQLYTPGEGRITTGRTALSDVSLNAWRKQIAYVAQDSGLFSGTIRDALLYGVTKAVTEEDITRVIATVGLTGFIDSLPNGVNTKLETWGSSLSGGQRQRIAIGRALLKDASVLIFDEPTSALDSETANGIADLIFHQIEDKTIILITHELSYISAADHIIVIKEGKVEEEGSHEELMAMGGVYKGLIEEQSYKEVFE